jgi:hypothetical protein
VSNKRFFVFRKQEIFDYLKVCALAMAELSHRQRLERCRAELSMLGDDAAEGDMSVNSADGSARAEQRRAAREESRRGRCVCASLLHHYRPVPAASVDALRCAAFGEAVGCS